MLQALTIDNFAIVEHLELQLYPGLTIISGETGAGKSILIDALSLVLGGRADTTLIRQSCETAQVQATFKLTPVLQHWLQENEIPDNTICHIRRIINQNGRSRATINEQTISVQILRELGEKLVDIHGQHAHQSLLKQEVQRQLLDDFSDNTEPYQRVNQAYQHWKTLKNALDNLGGASQDRESRLALLRYQVEELSRLELTPQAIAQLENEHRRLANIHKLLENGQHALNWLDAEDNSSTLSFLNQAQRELREVEQHDAHLSNVTNLLENAILHTEEAVNELRHYLDRLEVDPHRLQQIEQHIYLLQNMARKHHVNVNELPNYFTQLTRQLDELENYEQHANHLEQQLQTALQAYRVASENLHQQRLSTATYLAERISEHMSALGMGGGQFLIAVSADEEATPSSQGTDLVEFLVSTNPGVAPRPLFKVASGGELSRISLAIQVITAQNSGVSTLVFDEVDVGIGGRVAEIVGQLLQRLGEQRQVLCITHLPQVACQGHHHLQVSKSTHAQMTHIQINQLDNMQRVDEIARMLGGIDITLQTKAYAREMLQRSHNNTL